MAKDNLDSLLKQISGIDPKTIEGLIALSNSKNIKYLYEAIRVIKYSILRDEFSYPEMDPIKNAINKAYYKGGDYFLTMLVKLIKQSPVLADKIEESAEKK